MRRLMLVGLAVLVAASVPAGSAAHTSSTGISITAKTSNQPIGGLVYAIFGQKATISGNTADAVSGETVELQQSTFPFSSAFTTAAQTTTGSGGAYSFTTKPRLATRYRVVLASDSTSQSPVVTVYVGAHWISLRTAPCSGSICHEHFGVRVVYPAAVAKREARKPAYFYFGQHYGSRPTRVKFVKTGRQRRRGHTYRTGFSVSFSSAVYWQWEICTKDTEARDGLGLPGHHHCGDRSIPSSAIQKGWIG